MIESKLHFKRLSLVAMRKIDWVGEVRWRGSERKKTILEWVQWEIEVETAGLNIV